MKKQTIINTAFIVVPIVYLFLMAFKPYLREVSPEDFFFYDVAVDFNAPDICDKIHRWAHWKAGFGGIPIGLYRSECYQQLALKLKDPSLCRWVKPVSTLFADGSRMNSDKCIKDIMGGRSPDNSSHIDSYQKMLSRVGITEEKIRTNPRYSWLPKTKPIEDLFMNYFSDLSRSRGPEREAFLDAVRKL